MSQIQQLLHTVIIFTHEKHAQGSLSAFSLSLLNFIVEGDKDKNLGEIQLCKMSLSIQLNCFFFFLGEAEISKLSQNLNMEIKKSKHSYTWIRRGNRPFIFGINSLLSYHK